MFNRLLKGKSLTKSHDKKVPVKKYLPIKTRTSSYALTHVNYCIGVLQFFIHCHCHNSISIFCTLAGKSCGEHLKHLEAQHQTRGRLSGGGGDDQEEEEHDDDQEDDGEGEKEEEDDEEGEQE